MNCGSCDRVNQADARFCAGCGSPLLRTCTHCERELASDARFCDGCGQPIQASTTAVSTGRAATRKTVTALFCDLVGSTSFGEQVDAEASREAMGQYFEMARSVVEANGGTVAKFVGDGLLALFGAPEMAEDDAERAVRCGLALQVEFEAIRRHIEDRHGIEVDLRVGVNTGEVVIAAGDEDVVGDALNTAARLEAACTPGGVLVGESTWRLTRGVIDFGPRREIVAKGKELPVGCYQVEAAGPDRSLAEDAETPFVGREPELRRLQLVLEDTILERRARMVTVIGSPGVGKTRLARQMCRAVDGGTRAFELRIERSGGTTFAPIAELLRSVAGLADGDSIEEIRRRVHAVVAELDDAKRITELLLGFVGAGPVRSTEEMFLATRRLIEGVAAAEPVVLVVDDIQWAEPLFLDLLDHLSEWVQTEPLLVVGLARPEIREVRPSVTEVGRRVTAVVNLEGLSEEATTALAAELIGADNLPKELLAKIPASTDGNPLFVRELMRMLVDDGVIANRSGTWEMVIDVDAVDVPTINSLLASRVERIAPDQRRVLELASVVGSEFPVGAVLAASDEHTRADLDRLFEGLRRKDLVEATGTYWGDEPMFRFHHALIRDAAYRRLLKGTRAELHAIVGDWIERTAATVIGEHEVPIGHHFEQAHHYRRQLDLDDDDTRALGERASSLLHVAAARALERDDLAAAGALVDRALGCIGSESERAVELLLIGCEARLGIRDVTAGAPLVERLAVAVGDDRRLAAWVECFRVELTVLTDPDGLMDAEARAGSAAEVLEALGDEPGVAKARLQRAAALARLGRIGDCEVELDLALSAARAVDDRRRVTTVLGAAPVAALWGPSPVPRAGGRCLDVVRLLRITAGSPAVEATSVRCQALLEALRGRYDTARTMLDAIRGTLEELGLSHGLLETELYAGLVELWAGEPEAAEPYLRRAYEGLGRMGIGADAGQAAAHLARSVLLQGRMDEADGLAAESHGLAGQNPQTIIVSRSVSAEVLVNRGRPAEALVLAREAVQRAAETDILVDHAGAVATLARVLRAMGDEEQAAEAATEAAALYEQKGVSVALGTGPVAEAGEATDVRPDPESSSDLSGARPDPSPEHAVETEGDPSAEYRYWNEAQRLAALSLDALVNDFSAYPAMLADDVILEDRRPLTTGRFVGKEAAAARVSPAEDEGLDRLTWEASTEPIAVRGDHLALNRTKAVGGAGEVTFGWLAVTKWSAEGLMEHNVSFDPDDLAAALVELERLHQLDLDPIEALWFEAFAGMDAAINEQDIDRLMVSLDPDVVMVDHRTIGWPTSGFEAMVSRARSLFESVDAVAGVTERFHRFSSGGAVYSHRYRTTMLGGGSATEAHLIVTTVNVASGFATRLEQFAESELEAALDRYDELIGQQGPLESCPAVIVGGAVNMLARSDRVRALHDVVVSGCRVDRVDGTSVSLTTQDDLRAVGFGGPHRTVVAVRDDRLALVEVGLTDRSRHYSLEEIDESGRLARVRQFAPTELAAAMDQLDQRWVELYPAVDTEAGRNAVRAAAGMRSDDMAAMSARLHPDFRFIDHRPVGAGELDAEPWLSLLEGIAAQGGVFVAQIVHEFADRGFVLSAVILAGTGATDRLEMSPSLAVAELVDATIRRIEMFSPTQLDAALARFAEMGGADDSMDDLVAGHRATDWSVSGYWNEAHRLTSVALTGAAVDVEAWAAALGDDVVLDDRRRTTGSPAIDRAGTPDELAAGEPDDPAGWHVTSFEPIAARGDDFFLVQPVLATDDGRSPMTWIGLTEWRDSRLRRMTLFDDQDVMDAVVELDHRYADRLPAIRATFVLAQSAVTAMIAAGDLKGAARCLHPQLLVVDHRNLGWGRMGAEVGDRWGPLHRHGGPQLWAAQFHYLSDQAFCVTHELRVPIVPGADPSTQTTVQVYGMDPPTGLLRSIDEYEEDDLATALERCHELDRRVPGEVPPNQAVFIGAAIGQAVRLQVMADRAWLLSERIMIDGVELATADAAELTERLRSLGFGSDDRRVVAARGERLAVIDVGLDDGTRRFSLEEIDEDDRLVAVSQFGAEGRRLALDRLDERWTDIDAMTAADGRSLANAATRWIQTREPGTAIEAIAVRADLAALIERPDAPDERRLAVVGAGPDGWTVTDHPAAGFADALDDLEKTWLACLGADRPVGLDAFVEFTAAHNPVDADRLNTVLADDFEVITHNRLGDIDAADKTKKVQDLVEAGETIGLIVPRETHAVADHLVLATVAVTFAAAAAGSWANELILLGQERGGQVILQEQWDLEDLDLALARFDELANQPVDDATQAVPHNRAVEVMAAGLDAASAGDMDRFAQLIDDDIDYANHAPFSDRDGAAPELLNALLELHEENRTHRMDPVVVAGDRLAVFWLQTTAPNGYTTDWPACLELGLDDKAVAVHSWGRDDLRFALAHCRRRELAQVNVTEQHRALATHEILGNEERDARSAAGWLSDDFVWIDRRPGGVAGDLDREAWIARERATLKDHPLAATWTEPLNRSGELVLARQSRWLDPTAPEPEWRVLVLIWWRRNRAYRMELFDPDQESEVRARLEATVDT